MFLIGTSRPTAMHDALAVETERARGAVAVRAEQRRHRRPSARASTGRPSDRRQVARRPSRRRRAHPPARRSCGVARIRRTRKVDHDRDDPRAAAAPPDAARARGRRPAAARRDAISPPRGAAEPLLVQVQRRPSSARPKPRCVLPAIHAVAEVRRAEHRRRHAGRPDDARAPSSSGCPVMTSTSTPSAVSSRIHARCRVSPPPRIMARHRTSIVTRMRVRADATDRRDDAPRARGRRAPRCAWRDRAMPCSCCSQQRRHFAACGSSRAAAIANRAGSRAPSRSCLPGTSGAAARRSRASDASARRPAPTGGSPRGTAAWSSCASPWRADGCVAGELDHAVIENRASRFERMRHRRAIDLHQDVVGEIVALIPSLQPRQQRAVRATQLIARPSCSGRVAGRAQHVRDDDGFEQVVGKHRAAPDEPAFRTERHRAQPALAARVHRHEPRAGADNRAQRVRPPATPTRASASAYGV